MDRIQLIVIPLQDLEEIITRCVYKCLQEWHRHESDLKTVTEESTPEYLTKREVASLLRISETSVYQRTIDGEIKAYKSGKRVIYKRSEVLASLEVVPNLKNES